VYRVKVRVGKVAFMVLLGLTGRAVASPWAAAVVSYDPGATAAPGYTDPSVALGPPERFTGEGVFPAAVTMFNPPWGSDEIVSIGEGGHLLVWFDPPIIDDPANPYGIDLIVFGNTGFIDFDFPNGQQGSPPVLFGLGSALVEVSSDGVDFFAVGDLGDGMFPTQGYLDVGPFDTSPGLVPSNFRKPLNPALTFTDFSGLTYAESLALYDGAGGGKPIDIAVSGLSSIAYVRISVLDDGNAQTSHRVHIDALANVPEPTTAFLLAAALATLHRRRFMAGGLPG
jgi:hypothetical protein